MDMVWLEAECSRYEFFADVVAQTHPDIGLVALDPDPDKALELVAQLHETSPECSILVVSSSTDGNLILRAMRAGAKEFLTQPVRIEDLLAALERISERRFGRGDNKTRGSTVIAVAGATGGVGTTSLAVNLGCILAPNPQNSVALVDLDLCLGDADVFLDTIPDYTLVDVAQNVTRLDFTLLKRSLTKHSSGLYLLPRPVQLEDMALITPDDLQRVIGLLKATFTHLVLDLSKGYSADRHGGPGNGQPHPAGHAARLALPAQRRAADDVVRQDGRHRRQGQDRRQPRRPGQRHISLKKAEETIGSEIFWQLPNDYRTMVEVRNNGVPLIEQAPKAAITQSIIALADALCGDGAGRAAGGDADKPPRSTGC